ncbi:hypothetical protein GCM10020220_073000 [Nonomuraea rubra]
MTPPSPALPTEAELTDYLVALKTDNPQSTPSRPSYRGGPVLDPMTEDEYGSAGSARPTMTGTAAVAREHHVREDERDEYDRATPYRPARAATTATHAGPDVPAPDEDLRHQTPSTST